MGFDGKIHYQACKTSLPFLEFSYMIKLHMLKHTKPTLQMKQIHNSEKGKNSRQHKNPKQKPMTGKNIFLHIPLMFEPLMVQYCKMSHYPYIHVILHVMG